MHTVVSGANALSEPNSRFLAKEDPPGKDVGGGQVERNPSPNKYG